LTEHDHSIDFWNKYSLLCIIYQKAYNLSPETKVPIAPPKEALNKYGGKLSYETYHNTSKNDTIVEIYKLPLIPILLHIGELNKSTNISTIIQNNCININTQRKVVKTKKYVPIDPVRISQAEQNITQRTNTLLKSNFTLDKCLRRCSNK